MYPILFEKINESFKNGHWYPMLQGTFLVYFPKEAVLQSIITFNFRISTRKQEIKEFAI